MQKTTLIGLAVLTAFVLTANINCMICGGDVAGKIAQEALETAVEKGTGGKVDIDVSGKGVDLTGLPEFAKYPGAQGKGKWSMSGEDGSGSAYGLESGDAMDKVAEWYKSQVAGQGWKESMTMDMGDGKMLMFVSPDEKKSLTVTLSSEDGKTSIAIIYGEGNK